MDLALSSDQVSLVDQVAKLVTPYRSPPQGARATLLTSPELDGELLESGFKDVARYEGMGPLDAVLVAEVVHALPYAVEFATGALVGGAFGLDPGIPVALLKAPGTAPTRFLSAGATALVLDGEDVRMLPVAADMVEPVTSPFAYPLGKFKAPVADRDIVHRGAEAQMRLWWSVALAVEIGATAKAAVELAIEHVKVRRQFGRPIGSYQAIQHRLSECMVAVSSIQTLARRAAALGDLEAALAAAICAKEACPRIIYDTHQFHGASGVTYEVPLHFFTYRLRLLHGELGSLADCALDLAAARWSGEKADWHL